MGRSRLYNDDIDTERMQFHTQRIAKPLHREFGSVIPAAEGFAELSADGRYIDDPPGTLRPHRWQYKLREVREAEYVDVKLPTGFLGRHIFKRPIGTVARVVNQHVDTFLG
jgi:hypothetical protein